MKADRKEELLVRWMDGALSEEELRELEPVLKENPELEEERKALLTTVQAEQANRANEQKKTEALTQQLTAGHKTAQ